MQFTNNNYHSSMGYMDDAPPFEADEPEQTDAAGNPIPPDDALNFTARDLGTTTNPFANQLDSLKTRIREGASKIEFEFIGAGKGNSQRPTPESFGSRERQDIRELLQVNEMKTATHAAVHSESLAGFTREGFSADARAQVLKEIKKAIHFAGEATRGGAIVFHTNEWQRPLSEIKDGRGAQFKAYDAEEKDATMFALDSRTGRLIDTLSKDVEIFRPVFQTAQDVGLTGKYDAKGNYLNKEDWVDVEGNKISKNDPTQRLFDRVPVFQKGTTNFKVRKMGYDEIVKEMDEWNKSHPGELARTPAEQAAILKIENQVLQYKGNSLYHARTYLDEKKTLDRLREKKELFEKLKAKTPKEEEWRLREFVRDKYGRGLEADDERDPEEFLNDQIKFAENSLRHIHESSASADVMAKEAEEKIKHISSPEKYGLDKTTDTIASAGMEAMTVYNANKKKYKLTDAIYAAPENWDPRHFGSHPDEYRKIITKSREKMAQRLQGKGYGKEEAESLAKEHIKGTLDIGHMNLFRGFFQAKDGESPEKAEKRFQKWLIDEAENLVKEGYVGHIHVTDNFGFDDEHLTPGQGNVPMKEFLRKVQEAGIKDITVEQGSYNPHASIETLELINSPIYGVGRRLRYKDMKNAHFGYNDPAFFVAGSYVPSNDWRPWSDIPLE